MQNRKLILSDDPVLQEDLERIAASQMIDWECFRGKTIAVTGATGLIGSVLARALTLAGHEYGLDLKVLTPVRNREKAENMLGACKPYGLRIAVGDLTGQMILDEPVDYLIHGASVTSSKAFVEQPVETYRTAFEGTGNMLELARKKGLEGMVYLSSMEVYGVTSPGHEEVREADYGYIDPLQVRSSYSEGKRMTEGLCAAYAHEYQVPVRIARLAQTFGAGVPDAENRVFAQFAKSVINGEDIVLHTDGSKAHCYCYTTDAVLGILMILLKGETGEAYNVSNERTFSTIREMAELLVRTYPEAGVSVVLDIPEDAAALGYAPSSRMVVNSRKLANLGWSPQVDLASMYERLIDSKRKAWKKG